MPSLEEQFLAYKKDAQQLSPLLAAVAYLAKRAAKRIDQTIDAEDISQDVTLEVWKRLPLIDKDLVPRVLRITRNKVIDEQRKRKQPHLNSEDMTISSPELVSSRQRRKLEIASEVLGERITNLLEHGYSHEEIADLTGVPVSTIRSRIQRARKLFLAA